MCRQSNAKARMIMNRNSIVKTKLMTTAIFGLLLAAAATGVVISGRRGKKYNEEETEVEAE